MSVAESWNRITSWHEENAEEISFVLNPGLPSETIDKFEKLIGAPLPEDFRESLRLYDGSGSELLWFGEHLPLETIIHQWKRYSRLQNEKNYGVAGTGEWDLTETETAIKPIFWNPRRVFLTDNSGNHLTLDLDPSTDGDYGQVIRHCCEEGPREVIAGSWREFLSQIADGLESGNYLYDEDEEIVCPADWL